MKKSLFFIALVIFILGMPAVVFAGASDYIVNGNFESLSSGGMPNGWIYSVNSTCSVDSFDPLSGKNALRIAGGSSMYAVQGVLLEGGTDYVFEVWLKISSLSSGGSAGIKFQFKDSAGKYINNAQEPTYTYTDTNNSMWRKIRIEFATDGGAASAELLLRLINGGEVYWDYASIYRKEMVASGGFDTFSGWDTVYSSEIGITEGYDGNALQIRNSNSGKQPYAAQTITGIEGGAEYKLFGDFRIADTEKKKACIKLEYYDSQNKFIGYKWEYLGTAQDWKSFEYTFAAKQNCVKIILLLRLMGTGTVLFDNVSLQRTEGSVKFMKVIPETLFYYSENEKGGINVIVESVSFIPPENGKLVLKINDDERVLDSFDLGNAQDVQTVSFYTSLLASKAQGYTLLLESYTAGGSLTDQVRETIYRYDRPRHINDKGEFIDHDGGRIIPVIGYHISTQYYDKAVRVGINVVQCAYASWETAGLEKTLNTAQRFGIKVLINLYTDMKPAGHPDNAQTTLSCIEKFKDHPALFGWMVMDEPMPNSDAMYEYLKISYRLIRDADPDHPVYICECSPDSFLQSGQCCDVMCIDPYPAKLEAMPTRVYEYIFAAKAAVNNKKPVYALLQAWDWQGWEPSSNDLRHMLYQALMAGADGLGYYPLNDSDSIMWDLELWNGATGFALYEMQPVLKAFVTGEGTVIQNTKTDGVRYAVYENDGDTYVAALNLTAAPQSVTVTATEGGVLQDVNGGDKNSVTRWGDLLTIPLDAYQAACYKISSANLPSVSLWKGNTRQVALYGGEFKIRKSNAGDIMVYAALFEAAESAPRLLWLKDISSVDSFGVSLPEGAKCFLKVFCWNSLYDISPRADELYLLDSRVS